MMTAATDFQKRTKQNFLNFLNSALVVDEEATYSASKEPVKKLNTPSRESGVKNSDEENALISSNSSSHKLFCEEIINAFADMGIVCGVFRPKDGSSWTNRVVKAASNADIVILDWNIKVKDTETTIDETAANAGAHAVNIIKKLAENDLKSSRIRMIAIYTAETISDEQLLERIEKGVREIAFSNGQVNIQKNGNVMIAGPMTIAVVRKNSGLNGNLLSNCYDESGLPDGLLDILARQYNGLLMNAAVAAVTAVRQNTFQLLNLYSDQLDAAFAAHRMGLATPEEAEEHFLYVIVSDLQEILESANIADSLNSDTLLSWAEDLNERGDSGEKFFDVTFPEARETLQFLFTSGLAALDHYKKEDGSLHTKAIACAKKHSGSKRKDRKKRLTLMTEQFSTKAKAEESNLLWSNRTSIRHHYGEPAPFLSPGTIVQTMAGDKHEFLICVQQDCDCRRIPKDGKEFIFLPAVLVSGDQANTGDIYFKVGTVWRELKISIKGYDIQKIFFKPFYADDVVKACKISDCEWLFSNAKGQEYKWLGTLKSLHIQRIIHRLAQNISRIGVVESEWYRGD